MQDRGEHEIQVTSRLIKPQIMTTF
jgi:hypothetical protein